MFFTKKSNSQKNLLKKVNKIDYYANALFLIQNYPLGATEQHLNLYLNQQYKQSLKDLCIELLINGVLYENTEGDLLLLFKDPEDDKLAQLITYGNGLTGGSKILKLALNQRRH